MILTKEDREYGPLRSKEYRLREPSRRARFHFELTNPLWISQNDYIILQRKYLEGKPSVVPVLLGR